MVGANSPLDNISGIIALLCLIALAIPASRRPQAMGVPYPLVLGAGFLMAGGMALMQKATIWGQSTIAPAVGTFLFAFFDIIILISWISAFLALGPRHTAFALATSTAVCSGLNVLLAVLKPEAAWGATLTLPLISVLCLGSFRERLPESDKGEDNDLAFCKESRAPRAYLAMLAGSLFCYAVIFGQIHFQWVALQDGEKLSFAMQMGIAVGTLAAALALMALTRWLWSRRGIGLYGMFVIPLTLMSLWLSSYIESAWVFSYLVLLNLAQKLTNLMIILAPFTATRGAPSLGASWLAVLAFGAGKATSGLIEPLANSDIGTVISALSVVGLLACGFAMVALDGTDETRRARHLEASSVKGTPATVDTTSVPTVPPFEAAKGSSAYQPATPANIEGEAVLSEAFQRRYASACGILARRYQLTRREEEILLFSGRGRTAQHIAESLVISPATAKTHLRNIYAKMNVHTQQEVISLLEEEINRSR